MHDVYLLLYLLAVVFFAIAAFVEMPRRVTFIALGLMAWVLVSVIVTIRTG